ncbi:MAG: TrmH family RNA methyltransferase [Christensenellales bacterium]|jgi:TrmH family RNA methyltransferase
MRLISGRSNPLIKTARSLSSQKGRRESGLALVEGHKLVLEAMDNGFSIARLIVDEGKAQDYKAIIAAAEALGADVAAVDAAIMQTISDAKQSQGIAALIRLPNQDNLVECDGGLVVALERVQDPGNVGAIIRSADAFGAAAIALSSDCADHMSPKAIRASAGSVFHLHVYVADDFPKYIRNMKDKGFLIAAGHLSGEEQTPVADNTVLVIGNEGSGISSAVMEASDVLWRLPMKGKAESLNAAAAAAVMLYALAYCGKDGGMV